MSRLSVGHTVDLTIEKPAAGGRMIARVDGQVVLVSGAIPGERVTARVERVGKGVVYAATTEVLEPSPDRRAPLTDGACGGLLYAHIAYPRQLEIKAAVIADAFGRIGRLPLATAVPVARSPEEGYRMRARVHVRGGRWGFFREGTHTLCDARATRQLLPATCDAVDEALSRLIAAGALEAVRPAEGQASARSRCRKTSMRRNGRCISRAADASAIARDPLLARAAERQTVTDRLSILGHEVQLGRHVLAFFQGNRYLLGPLGHPRGRGARLRRVGR